ncbi:hypothetical protein RND81_02G178600 [Saponaria officinalis]|uniref:Uncharacterized protein n=1 Tax=Saponaria officinalis TaxID=3572 RepID=A0AAW1MVJ6_SAPOF
MLCMFSMCVCWLRRPCTGGNDRPFLCVFVVLHTLAYAVYCGACDFGFFC